jgi:hypothetical protein
MNEDIFWTSVCCHCATIQLLCRSSSRDIDRLATELSNILEGVVIVYSIRPTQCAAHVSGILFNLTCSEYSSIYFLNLP